MDMVRKYLGAVGSQLSALSKKRRGTVFREREH